IFILDVASLKKEANAVVKKKYCLANLILFVGPTEPDIYRNALLEKLLMEYEVYESAKEITKREEILLRIGSNSDVEEQCQQHGTGRRHMPRAQPVRQPQSARPTASTSY
nr:nuclear poly(A) polymerase 4-like [Tanacetum cinerariifolium]